jgi:hypothetical protein
MNSPHGQTSCWTLTASACSQTWRQSPVDVHSRSVWSELQLTTPPSSRAATCNTWLRWPEISLQQSSTRHDARTTARGIPAPHRCVAGAADEPEANIAVLRAAAAPACIALPTPHCFCNAPDSVCPKETSCCTNQYGSQDQKVEQTTMSGA